MSDYSQVPSTPANNSGAMDGLTGVLNATLKASEQQEENTTGMFIDNKVAEDRVMDNVRNGNVPLAVSSVVMGAIKGEVCSPEQLKTLAKEEKTRYDGIPMLQLAQQATESVISQIKGEDYKFGERTTGIIKTADSFAKAALTGGASVGVDLLVQAGRDANDTMDCHSGKIPDVPQTPAAQQAALQPKPEYAPKVPQVAADPEVVQVFKAPASKSIEIGAAPLTPAQESGLVENYGTPAQERSAPMQKPTIQISQSGPGM